MPRLNFSREEYRRIVGNLATEEDDEECEAVMTHTLRTYKSGIFGRVRIEGVPRLIPENSDANIGIELGYLLLLRILIDVAAVVQNEISFAPLVLSLLTILPFASKTKTRGPYVIWLLESIAHAILDVIYGRRTSLFLSLFVICFCLYSALTGDRSARSRK